MINRIIIGTVIGGIAITILFTILFVRYVEHPAFTTGIIDPAIFGQYGDVLGGVIGTVLGFLSVYLLFLTYQAQKIELAETKEGLKDQKQKDDFQLYLKLIDDIKYDFNSLRFGTAEGINVIKALTKDLKDQDAYRIKHNEVNHILNIIDNIVLQFEFLIEYIDNFKTGNTHQRDVLIAKLSIAYSSYLLEYITIVKKTEIPDHEIYTQCRIHIIELQDKMTPFYSQGL